MSQMLKSSGGLAAATMMSRLFGMLREVVYSGFMGVGWVADAFQLAFQIPNLFRRLLGEGALTAAFIPIFKEKERTSTQAEMWRAANAVVSGLVIVAVALIVLAMLGITIALAFGSFTDETELMLRLLRIMFPYMLFVCLTAIFMGMLNARGHFFIPATGALVMNLILITSVFLTMHFYQRPLHQQIYGVAIGVLVAGLAQALFQMPWLRSEGYRYQWVSPWSDPTVRRVMRQMIPGTIGIAAFQINVLTTQGIAFWVAPGTTSSFNYAVRLMELPQGVFGISLATYLLPTLSGLAAEKKYHEFRTTLNNGIDHLFFVNLLATILLFLLAHPIIRLLFEHGKFGPTATEKVTWALVCLSPGLLAFSLVNILARAFYALGDTKTPMKISIFCLFINLIFAFALVWRFHQGGLGMANTLSAVFNVGLLFYALRRKLGLLEFKNLRHLLAPILVAGCVAAVTVLGTSYLCEKYVSEPPALIVGEAATVTPPASGAEVVKTPETTKPEGIRRVGTWKRITSESHILIPRAIKVFVPMAAASIVYWLVALAFKVPPAMEMGGLILKRFAARRGK